MLLLNIYGPPTGNKENHKNPTYWINVQYIKCLESKLPCECEKHVKTYFTFVLDTADQSYFYKYSENESDHLMVRKDSKNRYDIYAPIDSSKILGTVIQQNDSIYLSDADHIKSVFIQFNPSGLEKLSEYGYEEKNIDLLNAASVKRGYSSFQKILGHDTLVCTCNKETGNLNMISVPGRNLHWILERKKGLLYIYKIMNDDNADPEDPLIKKLVAVLKW